MSVIPYWGIDGCKAGWFCIGLGADGGRQHFVAPDISAACAILCQFRAKIALIDIPIGLSENADERKCDKEARQFVGRDRQSSVFRTPCRQAIDAYRNAPDGEKESAGIYASEKITGLRLPKQTWAIAPKIAEVDSFLRKDSKARELFREVHPEVCFRAFKNAPLINGKSRAAGKKERKEILHNYLRDIDWANIREELRRKGYTKTTKGKGVGDDDILDAAAAAITAWKGDGEYNTLPQNPPKDSRGLPMEMVYWKPH